MFLDFYQLREQPFGVTPDPAYLYPSRTHCQALDSLTEAILGDRGFLALIAEPGMGKTTLLYQVLERLRDSARSVFLFQTQCNSHEFFQYLMSELGVNSTGMGIVAMHEKLNDILFAEMLDGRRFVLIVDEAQNLDDSVLETIRLLSNFETPHAKLLQIVLAGQPQLAEKLAQPHMAQLLQRITTLASLQALSPEETVAYVQHRLKVAGNHDAALFELDSLALVAARSRGVPRIINRICFRALMEAYDRGQRTVSPDVIESACRSLDPLPAAPPEIRTVAAPIPSPGPARTPQALRLSYKASRSIALPRWVLWAGTLGAILLSANLALPSNTLKKMTQRVRNGVTATRNLVQRESALAFSQSPRGEQISQAQKVVDPNASQPAIPSVTAIQASSAANDSQVVVLLDDAVQFDSARVSSPERIYFDLHRAHLLSSVSPKTFPNGDGLLRSVRAAQNSDDVVRLVLEHSGAQNYSAQLLSNPYRLVIDLHAQPNGAQAFLSSGALSRNVSVPLPTLATRDDRPLTLARELGLKINRIVIDPGHGGSDTGTMGPHGLLEKDLCLDVALRLGRLIQQNIAGTEVLFTRTDDRHVPLELRTAFANDSNADLFISIHANSTDSRQIRGVETFYMSLAASPQSRELAARENSTAQSSLHDLPDLLRKLARNEKIAESMQLATDIQNSLSQRLQIVSRQETNRGVKRAPFLVLTGANMPAVLSEISFVSNPSDEKMLFETAQRQRVAEGLYRGIAAYLGTLHNLPIPAQKLVKESSSSSSASFPAVTSPLGPGSR